MRSDIASVPPWRPSEIALLAVLLAVHGYLAVDGARTALATPFALYEPRPYLAVGLVALGGAFAAMWRYRGFTHTVGWTVAVALAVALAGPGAAVAVALVLLAAASLGRKVLDTLDVRERDLASSLLIGLALALGLLAALASLKLHYAPVYVVLIVGALAATHRSARAVLADVAQALRTPGDRTTATAFAAALLCAVAVLHVFVAARPEAGYDANTMHLQVPLALAHDHRFRFDVTRYAWAVMPLGADWLFSAAYFLGGEAATRLANLAFGALAGGILYLLLRRAAPAWIALVALASFVATPLAFLESGSLLVEGLWLAFLLGTLLFVVRYVEDPVPGNVVAFASSAAGAMQCKAIAFLWLAPLALALVWVAARRKGGAWRARHGVGLALAAVVAAWPYANAWIRTGNPVFPFFNGWFRSPYFGAENFANEVYHVPLRWTALYDIVLRSADYIEGLNGAAGLHWLLLLPVIAVALVYRGTAVYRAVLTLGAVFFVAVYAEQAVLRYLIPVFALWTLLGGWALAALPDGRTTRGVVLALATVMGVLALRLIYTGSWVNAELCPSCAFDAAARERYLARYMPDKLMGSALNRLLPADARVGFFMPNAPTPAGFVGYGRMANWHDYPAFQAIALAPNTEALVAVVRRFGLTHVVCRDPPEPDDSEPIRVFCATRVTPVWRGYGRVVGTVARDPP